MAQRHQRSFRKTPANRNWAGIEIATQTIAGNTAVLLATFVLTNPGIDETILRSLASFIIRSDQLVATESQVGALGMIIVSDQAAGVGITAVPHPVTDIDDDGWFVHMPIAQAIYFGDATGFTHIPGGSFDSKAKRVVHDGQTIALVVENVTATGFSIAGIVRSLSMVRGT